MRRYKHGMPVEDTSVRKPEYDPLEEGLIQFQRPRWDERAAIYNSYIKSPLWESKKEAIYFNYGNACELCGDKYGGLEVHHNTYSFLKEERNVDLIILCKRCHHQFHQDFGYGGKKLNEERNPPHRTKCSLCAKTNGKLKTTVQDENAPQFFKRELTLCTFCIKITKEHRVRKVKKIQ